MDCQKLMVYGVVVLVGLYLLRETCGIKLPFIDSFEGYADSNMNNENIVEGIKRLGVLLKKELL